MTNIRDVALQAGVSIATVSRVLNGTAKVSIEVKKRVEEAMLFLAYQPNPAARSLRTNRSHIIGLLIPDIHNPFFISLIHGVEEEALRHAYSLILCNSNEDPKREQQYLEVLYAERVAGVLIVPTRKRLGEIILKKFQERYIPLVVVDRRVQEKHLDVVLLDSVRGANEAVGHLISNGYRRIGVVTGPLAVISNRDRLEGYRKALQEAGIKQDPALERSGPVSIETGKQLVEELLKVKPRIDALFLTNNQLTLGALNTLQAYDLRIPGDLAVVGYNEIAWAAIGSFSLTTVMEPAYELGCEAALRLFHHLKNPGIQSRKEVILTPILNIRTSSHPLIGQAQTALPAL